MFNFFRQRLPAQNLLYSIKRKKNKRVKKKLLIAAIVIVVFFTVGITYAAAIYVPRIKDVVTQAQQAKSSLDKAQIHLLAQDFPAGRTEIANAEQSLSNIKQSLENLAWIRFIPYARTQYTAAYHVTDGAVYMVDGIKELVTVIENILIPLQTNKANNFESISDTERQHILAALYESRDELESVQQTFKKAVTEMEKVPDRGLIRQLKETLAPIQEQVPKINATINSLAPLSRALPTFLGYPTQQNYLLLFQNNTELRPTGGFIGTYGIVKLRNADVVSLESDNVYNLDEPAKERGLAIEPPSPLFQYNKVTQWFLRDSNWSPDFPTSAKQALEMYRLEGGAERYLDGVLALDPTFIVSLLEITGPVMVSNTEFSSDNFVQKLQEHVSQGFQWKGIDVSERKDIIGDLGDVLMEQLYQLPKLRWQEIFIALEKNLSQKHLLIWSVHDDVQLFVQEQGWDGQVPTDTTQNNFMIIDANLASLKTDPAVSRSTAYQIQEHESGEVQITVRRTYTNTGKLNWNTTRYRTYTRMYVPLGSSLNTSEGAMIDCKKDGGTVETTEELSHSVFSFFICIEPGDERTITIVYTLPADRFTLTDAQKDFSVNMIKQAGTPGDTLHIQTEFQRKVTGVSPHLDKIQEISNTQFLLEDSLDRDTTYTYSFD